MTEIEKVKGEIKVLEAKLALLEEMENYKTPAEEAYKNTYGNYPMGEPFWIVFKKGYEAAQSTKEDTVWKSLALKYRVESLERELEYQKEYAMEQDEPTRQRKWILPNSTVSRASRRRSS